MIGADFVLALLARVDMIELLLRGIYAERALQADDPPAFITKTIEGLIAHMDGRSDRPPAGSLEAQLWTHLENALGVFLDQVLHRLAAVAAQRRP